MKKTLKISLFSFVLIFSITHVFANSTITSADSFSQVQKIVSQIKDPKHLLVALDDDDTLTMTPCYPYSVGSTPKTQCQYLAGPSWFTWQSELPKNNPNRVWKTFSQLIEINALLFDMTAMPLDDPKIPAFLNDTQKRGAHIIIETARGYTMMGSTEQQFTQDHIMSIIEVSAIKTPTGHISFPGYYLPTPWNNHAVRPIAYLHGVLYVAGLNKGVMLQQFLAKTEKTKDIHTIVFVDDTFQNVQDVAAAYAKDPNVNVISIHYVRLAKQKAAFLNGKNAAKLQAITTQQWQSIRDNLRKNVSGFAF